MAKRKGSWQRNHPCILTKGKDPKGRCTITTKGIWLKKGNRNSRATIDEMKSMQCFPKSFKLTEGRTQALKELGNAFPPCAAKRFAKRIKSLL